MSIDSVGMLDLLLVTLASFGVGALGALLMARAPKIASVVAHGGALLGAIAALMLGLSGLAGRSLQLELADLLPVGGAVFSMDRLSAFFVVVTAVGAIPAALYAIGSPVALASWSASGFVKACPAPA